MREEFIWAQKYRPQTVQDTILPDDIKQTFQDFVDQKNIPNLLLSGSSGCGKTTIAKAMLEELGCDYIVINSSLNGNIDTLRNEILTFASSVSFTGGRKYVILDEADHLNCFDGGQMVQIFEDGKVVSKTMEELSDTMFTAITYNFETNKIELAESAGFLSGEEEVFEIEFEDGTKMICTKDHEFFKQTGETALIVQDEDLFNINNIELINFIEDDNESIYLSDNK